MKVGSPGWLCICHIGLRRLNSVGVHRRRDDHHRRYDDQCQEQHVLAHHVLDQAKTIIRLGNGHGMQAMCLSSPSFSMAMKFSGRDRFFDSCCYALISHYGHRDLTRRNQSNARRSLHTRAKSEVKKRPGPRTSNQVS